MLLEATTNLSYTFWVWRQRMRNTAERRRHPIAHRGRLTDKPAAVMTRSNAVDFATLIPSRSSLQRPLPRTLRTSRNAGDKKIADEVNEETSEVNGDDPYECRQGDLNPLDLGKRREHTENDIRNLHDIQKTSYPSEAKRLYPNEQVRDGPHSAGKKRRTVCRAVGHCASNITGLSNGRRSTPPQIGT